MASPPRVAVTLGLALLAAGLLFAAPFLLVPGLALAALGALVPLVVRARAAGVRVESATLPARVEEGAPFELSVVITPGRLPGRAELRHDALSEPVGVRLRGGVPVTVRAEGAPMRRGRHELGAPRLALSDPLGLSELIVTGGAASSILVVPAVEPVVVPAGSAGGTLGRVLAGEGVDGVARGRTAADPDLEGLRPHLDGSPASRIYWPALARTGELLERRFSSRGGGGPVVALDASGGPSPEALDRAVRAAASLVHELARETSCELLLPAGATVVGPALSGWPSALAALALVEAADAGPPRLDVPGVIVVSAAGTVPAGFRGYFVSARPVPGRRVAFSVAGCHGQRLDTSLAPRAAA